MRTIAEILKGIRPEFEFEDSEDFIADGMLDSLDVITLVSDLEKTYGVSIPGVDILPENFRNIAVIKELLKKHSVAP